MHGKVTGVHHNGTGLFAGIPQNFRVTRYHSLVVEEAGLPSDLQVDARSEDGAVMGISDPSSGVYGVQFHPERSGAAGAQLLKNFLEM